VTDLGSLPELGLFEPAATRRAVLRGLLRTALIALALVLVFLSLGEVAGRASYRLHNGSGHFDRVLAQGWVVGHPGVAATVSQGKQSTEFGWLHATERFRFTQPDGSRARVTVRQDLLGHVSVKGDVGSRLDQVLGDGQASRAQAMAFAKGLPAAALTEVVVVLRQPLHEQAASDFDGEFGLDSRAWFYEDPFAGARDFGFGYAGDAVYSGHGRNPVSWPPRNDSDLFRGRFPDWTAELSSRDDANLERLGLPSSAKLKELGESALVHGLLLQDLTPTQLLSLLADPAVESFTPVDVRFDILQKEIR
jgi:hypothetical protein